MNYYNRIYIVDYEIKLFNSHILQISVVWQLKYRQLQKNTACKNMEAFLAVSKSYSVNTFNIYRYIIQKWGLIKRVWNFEIFTNLHNFVIYYLKVYFFTLAKTHECFLYWNMLFINEKGVYLSRMWAIKTFRNLFIYVNVEKKINFFICSILLSKINILSYQHIFQNFHHHHLYKMHDDLI